MSQSKKFRPTLRDIAKHANVSVSTVSRALNNHTYVDDATRAAIQAAVQELNYPLENLRGQNHIGREIVLLSRGDFAGDTSEFNFGADFEKLICLGATNALSSLGYRTEVHRTYMKHTDAQPFVETFTGEGVILLGGMMEPEFISALYTAEIPFVIAGSQIQDIPTNCVIADNIGGIEKAVAALAQRERQCIGLVNSSTLTMTSQEKLKGLQLGLQQHGLSFDSKRVINSADFDLEAGYRQTKTLIERVPDLDAIIYGHDVMAMGGLKALRENGSSVPGDVAIIGFHDYEIANFTDPPLTTIRFDTELMGSMAARRLVMMIDNPDGQHWHLTVPTELVVRHST